MPTDIDAGTDLRSVRQINMRVNDQLSHAFTPLADVLTQTVMQLDFATIQRQFLTNLRICRADYTASKYNPNTHLPPTINRTAAIAARGLTSNETSFYDEFLEHVNNVAVLKPYNLAEFLTGNFTQYLWLPREADVASANNHAADSIVIPIGEYGEDLALLMLLTTHILLKVANSLIDSGKQAESEYWDVLSVETLRGRKKAEKLQTGEPAPILSTLDTLSEGIQSVQATFASLSAEKIPGLSFSKLIDAVIKADMADFIARRVPFSYTLPSIRQGLYFQNILSRSGIPDQPVELTRSFTRYCKTTHDIYYNSRLIVNGTRHPGYLGTGCPLAKKVLEQPSTGISILTQGYQHVFALLSDNLNLDEFKASIFQPQIIPGCALIAPQEQADECEAYNVDKNLRHKAKFKLAGVVLSEVTKTVLDFWFGQSLVDGLASTDKQNQWFNGDRQFDAEIRHKFAGYIELFSSVDVLSSPRTAHETLALIILFDQFPRNAYRGTKQSFAYDQLATQLSFELIESNQHISLPSVYRWFTYMPLQHSENRQHQALSVELFSQLHREAKYAKEKILFAGCLAYAKQHQQVVDYFDRFPHRNSVLGRESKQLERYYISLLNGSGYYSSDFFQTSKPKLRKNRRFTPNHSVMAIMSLTFMSTIYFARREKNDALADIPLNPSMIFMMLCILAALLKLSFMSNRFSFFHSKNKPVDNTEHDLKDIPEWAITIEDEHAGHQHTV